MRDGRGERTSGAHRVWVDRFAIGRSAVTNRLYHIFLEETGRQAPPGFNDARFNIEDLLRNVSTLRKALGESPDEHRYIVTIPGRGYRFVAQVRGVTDEEERPSIRSNATEPAGDGVDESVGAEDAALDRTAVSDEEVVATADRRVKRPSPLTSRRQSIVLALAALVILLAAVGGLVGWYFRPKAMPPEWRAVPLTSYPGFERNPALSPRTATRWLSRGTARSRTTSISTSS